MELEVKFLISDPGAFTERLRILGAQLEKPRIHETNLRFDTPTLALRDSYQVLRLRQDAKMRVTYKGPGVLQDGVRARQEIEFEVDNFKAAKALFEALGYEVSFIYEKFRTTYHYETVEIVFDETPIGTFAEIEGPKPEAIQVAARALSLNWDARINDSYVYLFEKAQRTLGLSFRDLTFENFQNIAVSPDALGVQFGD
ncbi:MAG: class IV adenylate cyclase [Anaerolineales bacterium]|nr:class IV adenylate cyclase [Anaerolineales bacterium]